MSQKIAPEDFAFFPNFTRKMRENILQTMNDICNKYGADATIKITRRADNQVQFHVTLRSTDKIDFYDNHIQSSWSNNPYYSALPASRKQTSDIIRVEVPDTQFKGTALDCVNELAAVVHTFEQSRTLNPKYKLVDPPILDQSVIDMYNSYNCASTLGIRVCAKTSV